MHFKTFKILGKSRGKLERKNDVADNTPATQMDGLGNNINNRTKDLEKAEQQLKELASKVKSPEESVDTVPRPHGPIGELTLMPGTYPGAEPEVELVVQKVSAGSPSEKTAEKVNVVEGKAQPPSPAQAKEPAPAKGQVKEPPVKEEEDTLRSLFAQDEDEVNPLASLISSLPDVSTRELLDDLQEIREIMKETKQSN